MYRLDRTLGIAHKLEQDPYKTYWQNQPMMERLKAAFYLNSVAFYFSISNPHKLDRQAFSMHKLDE